MVVQATNEFPGQILYVMGSITRNHHSLKNIFLPIFTQITMEELQKIGMLVQYTVPLPLQI